MDYISFLQSESPLVEEDKTLLWYFKDRIYLFNFYFNDELNV